MYAVEIRGLTKHYRVKKQKTPVEALKGLDLTVEQGEVIGFLGPNGAGKSTTIKCLMGLIRPTAGSASIMGHDISSPQARREVGYLPENPAFYDYLSAEEYLLFVGKVFCMEQEALRKRCEEALKMLELWEPRKRLIRTYSKGMVQRLGLAQVLIHDPAVYLLDEPMSGLDPLGRALVKEIILGLKKRGKCIFFSTHITDDIEKVCDRVAVINKGELLALDRVQHLLERGVEGYSVTVTGAEGAAQELFVDREKLPSFLKETLERNLCVEKIEPRRKNMEAFFLELMAR